MNKLQEVQEMTRRAYTRVQLMNGIMARTLQTDIELILDALQAFDEQSDFPSDEEIEDKMRKTYLKNRHKYGTQWAFWSSSWQHCAEWLKKWMQGEDGGH